MYLQLDIYGNIEEYTDIKCDRDIEINKCLAGEIFFDTTKYFVEDKKLCYVYTPVYMQKDIYFVVLEDRVVLSDQYFLLAGKLRNATCNEEAIIEFRKTGLMRDEQTWLNEISRLKSGRVYKYVPEKGFEEFLVNKIATKLVDFQTFKDTLEKVIYDTSKNKKCAVLLSGGADSRLLAILLNNIGKLEKTYTLNLLPLSESVYNDYYKSKMISKILGVENEAINLDTNDIKMEFYDKLIYDMPLSSHLAINFDLLVGRAKQQGIECVYTGQNLDNLYNYGPTAKFNLSFYGAMDLAKRYMLSDIYFKSLHGCKQKSILNAIFNKPIGAAIALMYSYLKCGRYYQPENLNELIDSFINSYDSTPFVKKGIQKKYLSEKMSCKEAHAALLDKKITGYINGGAAKSISTAGKKYGLETIFPYSMFEMVNVVSGVPRNLNSILSPKKYVYDLINEQKKRYGSQIAFFGDVKESKTYRSIHDTYKYILQDTEFGRSLRGELNREWVNDRGTSIQVFSEHLNLLWEKKVMDYLNHVGVLSRGTGAVDDSLIINSFGDDEFGKI